MFCHPITSEEKETLDDLVSRNERWTCWNSCASFASHTFHDVTDIDIDADDGFWDWETPREIGKNIIAENSGKNLPDPLPWEENRRNLQDDSSSSGAVEFIWALSNIFEICFP